MRLRLEQRAHLERRLQQLLVAPRPEQLATASEQAAAARLERLAARLGDGGSPTAAALLRRIRRLQDVLTFTQQTAYHQRLTDAHRHLRELNANVDALRSQYDAFVRTRQAATHSFAGYEEPIRRLRTRIVAAQERLDGASARQGHVLEVVASEELEARRERLEAYLNQARFAFADSYDRAAKAQAQ
jgi:chromosome segregation ATPase